MAWLLLRPARGPGQPRQPQRAIALPISCDASLPDYIVKAEVFEKGMRRHWHKQDRFRMFFASSYTNKTGQSHLHTLAYSGLDHVSGLDQLLTHIQHVANCGTQQLTEW